MIGCLMNDSRDSEMRHSSGNGSTLRKCTPVPLYLPQISYDLAWAAAVESHFIACIFKGKQPILLPFLTNL